MCVYEIKSYSISSGVMIAVPIFSTTTLLALFAYVIPSSRDPPFFSLAVTAAIYVSPAHVTSMAFVDIAGLCITFPSNVISVAHFSDLVINRLEFSFCANCLPYSSICSSSFVISFNQLISKNSLKFGLIR